MVDLEILAVLDGFFIFLFVLLLAALLLPSLVLKVPHVLNFLPFFTCLTHLCIFFPPLTGLVFTLTGLVVSNSADSILDN